VFITECEFDNADMVGDSCYLMEACIRHSYTSISEVIFKSSKLTNLKLWFA